MNEIVNDGLTYIWASFIDFVAENRWTQACDIPYVRRKKTEIPIVKPHTVWRSLGSGLQLDNNRPITTEQKWSTK